jgi:hypothetical protein
MSDITKCSGLNCPLKDNCKRYNAIDGMWQSYFTEVPYKDGKCDMFWGAESESILNQLKKITLGCLILTLFSCGSVKKSSTETEIKTESEKNIEIDATKFSSSFTLEPMDLSKPILLGKDTIYNTRIIYNNSKEVIKEKSNEVNKSDLKQDINTKDKDYSVVIEKLANKFIWLIGILFVLFIILNWIKNKTPRI